MALSKIFSKPIIFLEV